MAKPKVWTSEETEFLRQNFMKMTNADLAKELNVTQASVRSKLRRMKLVRKPLEEQQETPPVTLEQADSLYYEQRDYAAAAQEFADAAKRATDPDTVARALYWQAECRVKLGERDAARKILRKITDTCADHFLGSAAERRLASLGTD
jgi:tetratricopeptide (TPR) repeat protein